MALWRALPEGRHGAGAELRAVTVAGSGRGRAPTPRRRHYAPARARAIGRSDAAVPILTYHVIAAAPARAPFPALYGSGVRPIDRRSSAGAGMVHASWNGATEVVSWQLLQGAGAAELRSRNVVALAAFCDHRFRVSAG